MMSPLLLFVLAAAPTAEVDPLHPTERAPGAARRMTFTEAVELAGTSGLEVIINRKGTDAFEERVQATRALLFPRVQTSGNVLIWNEPLVAAGFGNIRDQVTASLSFTVAQPVTGLAGAIKLLEVEKLGKEVSKEDEARARLDSGYRAAEAYLRLLQARALADVSAKSVVQVEAQLQRAKALEAGGVLGKVDVLRIESAVAQAKQGTLRATAGVSVAEKGLVLAINLDGGERIEPVDDLPEAPPPPAIAREDALKLAHDTRPEKRAANMRIEQANAGAKAAFSPLIPNILLIATFQHTEGQAELFQPKNSFFAGATLEYTLWDWGRTWDQYQEAKVREEQAQLGARGVSDMIDFDVERRVVDAQAAHEMLGVAKSGLVAAEEAQRIQTARFEQGAATTTDVLDAETDLLRARSGMANARYEYFIAQAALSRALGRLPTIEALR